MLSRLCLEVALAGSVLVSFYRSYCMYCQVHNQNYSVKLLPWKSDSKPIRTWYGAVNYFAALKSKPKVLLN